MENERKYTEDEIQRAQKKIKGKGIRFENLDHRLQEALLNPYAEEYRKGKLDYTFDFYLDLFDLIQVEKKNPDEAFAELGFDGEYLGKNAVTEAVRRARKIGRELGLYDPTSPFYNGSQRGKSHGKKWIQEELSCFETMAKQLEKKTEKLERLCRNQPGYGSPEYQKKQ